MALLRRAREPDRKAAGGLRALTVRSALAVASSAAVLASVTEARAVVGGAPDVDHVAVVALQPVPPSCGERPTETICTGTLVAPRVVITAAHCLGTVDAAQVIAVTFATDVSTARDADRVRVVDARLHPAWSSGVNDIALLLLAQDAPVAPANLALDAPATMGASVRVVGFGVDDAGHTGRRLGGIALVATVRAGDFDLTSSPAMTCEGDSGGPALEDDGTGERIVGLASFGDSACTTGTETRVDAVAAFLTPAIAELSHVVTARPSLDVDADACATPCATHGDCPIGMACIARSDATRTCAIAGLEAGHFGAACSAPDGDRPCVNAGASCRLWVPCATTTLTAGGCAVTHHENGSGWLAILVAAFIATTARARLRIHSSS